jgi:hypothetical protein
VPYIADIKPPKRKEQLRAELFKSLPYYATIKEVEQEEARRDKEIKSYAD